MFLAINRELKKVSTFSILNELSLNLSKNPMLRFSSVKSKRKRPSFTRCKNV